MPEAQTPQPDLWSPVRRLLALLLELFGGADALRRIASPSADMRAAILSLLHPAELIARRILLCMAGTRGAMPPARQRVRTPRCAPPRLIRTPRFILIPPPSNQRAAREPGDRPLSAMRPQTLAPLANRLGALLRVVENPAPYAARLARRLRKCAPAAPLIERLLREPRQAGPFSRDIEDANDVCWSAAEYFCDTS